MSPIVDILYCSQRARQIKRAEREKKESEELERQSKYPKHVIVNEKAINSQPIAKYQVCQTCNSQRESYQQPA